MVRAAWSKYKGKDNPDLRLLDLDKVAALIEADFPTKLYYVPLRNSLFDTHVNQAAPHDRQLEYCSDAIAGFFQEMKRIGRADDVVMYVHSEFGRRVPENTSLGTDHGTAQVNFVIGNAVKGGLYGTPPSLTNLVLGDNLESTTDFRQVYATLIEEWLGVDADEGAGTEFKTLRHVPGLAGHFRRTRWPLAWAGLRDRRPGRTIFRHLRGADWNYDRAAHLLAHAGFGGTPAEIQKLAEAGLERAVRSLVHYESIPNPKMQPFVESGFWDPALERVPGKPPRSDRARGKARRLYGRQVKPSGKPPGAAGVRSLLLLAARDNARNPTARLLVGKPDAADHPSGRTEDGVAVARPLRHPREQGARLPQDDAADRPLRARRHRQHPRVDDSDRAEPGDAVLPRRAVQRQGGAERELRPGGDGTLHHGRGQLLGERRSRRRARVHRVVLRQPDLQGDPEKHDDGAKTFLGRTGQLRRRGRA